MTSLAPGSLGKSLWQFNSGGAALGNGYASAAETRKA